MYELYLQKQLEAPLVFTLHLALIVYFCDVLSCHLNA